MVKHSKFLGSFTKISQCPSDGMPEYAFIGRSNVGKSSLINCLTERKQLAKVSHTPGKTQLLNFFNINDEWYLVDLPGYGYAKVAKTQRNKWDKMIRNYLVLRETLSCVFVLIDSRLPPQKIDLEFIQWLGESQVPFALVFTKVDKLKASERKNITIFKKAFLKLYEALPSTFVTSSVTGEGKDELILFIEGINSSIGLEE